MRGWAMRCEVAPQSSGFLKPKALRTSKPHVIIRSSHDGDGVRHLPLRDGDDGDVLPNLRAFLRARGVRGGTCQSSGRFQGASQ